MIPPIKAGPLLNIPGMVVYKDVTLEAVLILDELCPLASAFTKGIIQPSGAVIAPGLR